MRLEANTESTEDWQKFFNRLSDHRVVGIPSKPANRGIGNMFGNQANYSLPLISRQEKKPMSSEKITIISESEASVDRAKSELAKPSGEVLGSSNLISTDSIPIPSKSRSPAKNLQKGKRERILGHSRGRKRAVVSQDLLARQPSVKKRKRVASSTSGSKQYSKYKKIF